MKLRDLGEDRLLNELLPRLSPGKAVVAGPRDDCAVVETQDRGKLLVLKTDCVVEGVHFLRGTNALDVGWKAMMRPLSDFAATSAVPQFALITLMLSEKTDVAWVKRLYQGLRTAADRFRVRIVGGDTSSTPGAIAISASVIGFVERDRWVSRGGGKPGDDLFVTGRLGGQPGGGEAAQFVVDQRQQLSGGLGRALVDGVQQLRNFGHCFIRA